MSEWSQRLGSHTSKPGPRFRDRHWSILVAETAAVLSSATNRPSRVNIEMKKHIRYSYELSSFLHIPYQIDENGMNILSHRRALGFTSISLGRTLEIGFCEGSLLDESQ